MKLRKRLCKIFLKHLKMIYGKFDVRNKINEIDETSGKKMLPVKH